VKNEPSLSVSRRSIPNVLAILKPAMGQMNKKNRE